MEYEDVHLEPYVPSHYFSAERHEALNASHRDGQVWTSEILQLENIVAENSNSVITEARTLLQQWVESSEANSDNDISLKIRLFDVEDLDERILNKETRQMIHGIVREVIGSTRDEVQAPSSASQDPRKIMEARQALVRDRREMMQRIKQDELQKKIEQKRLRTYEERKKRDADRLRLQQEIRERQKAQLELKALQQQIQEDKRFMARSTTGAGTRTVARAEAGAGSEAAAIATTTKQPIEDMHIPLAVTALHSEQAESIADAAASERALPQTVDDAETSNRLDAAATDFLQLRRMRAMRSCLRAWTRATAETHDRLTKFLTISNWRAKNRLFSVWLVRLKKLHIDREAKRQEALLKAENESLIKALRHHRRTLISKYFVCWVAWIESQKHEQELQRQHKERLKRMKDLLQTLEAQHNAAEEAHQDHANEMAEGRDCCRQGDGSDGASANGPRSIRESMESSTTQDRAALGYPASTSSSRMLDDPETVESQMVRNDGDELIISTCPTQDATEVSRAESRSTTGPRVPLVRSVRKPTEKFKITRSKHDERLLRKMEERDRERKERLQAAEERRLERERKQRVAEEEEKRKMEEAEREERRQMLLEKKRQLEEEQKREAEKLARRREFARLLQAAQAHHQQSQIKYFGVLPWKRLVCALREQMIDAQRHRDVSMVKSAFTLWLTRLEARQRQEQDRAVKHHRTMALRQCLELWNERYCAIYSMRQGAHVHAIQHHQRRAFADWKVAYVRTSTSRLEVEREKEARADKVAQRIVSKRCLRRWRSFVSESKEEKWREFRRQMLRERVHEILSSSRLEEVLKFESI